MSDAAPGATEDVTIDLGDASVHAHQWRSRGKDKAGAHELVCECGETGVGYGEFPRQEA